MRAITNRSATSSPRRRTLFERHDITDTYIQHGLPRWATKSFTAFLSVILDPKFPCAFAAPGLWRGLYRFAFVPDPRAPHCAEELAAVMEEYLGWLDTLPREEEPYAVLMVFCAPIGDIGEDAYRAAFEKLLCNLNVHDKAAWPAHIPRHPDDVKFTFCFGGREIFVNANTPSHHHRRSRNLGPSLTLVIQPRDAFDKIATKQMREGIRARIPKFDGGMPASPEIGAFGDENNREWGGYLLSDTNEKAAERVAAMKLCPFVASTDAAKRLARCPYHRAIAFFRKLTHRVATFLHLY
jgi:FPC/CPF motif-containing protein YcgG